ncbi:low molecular weight phosphatase family protein [Gordonia desulfuricans]|uniref:Low molecular weight phosphatase family protein n=1 Tax=Gordonia desulfuricans TaxID=89051 RepID=A0A7K3LKG2_9ACTN|nr:low molecular weight phosphatase family protein [Gordonia desulfuricans]NDK88653.1 low molecular weight phosphatase family protein [Gordonia desulfuricans]
MHGEETATAVPKVLFVCVSNRGKSVMAEGLSRQHATVFEASSAGTIAKVDDTVNAMSAEVLAEVGVDIYGHRPRQLTDDMMRAADLVVAIGTAARIDPPDGVRVEVWDTDEPSVCGIDGVERMRLIRDDIAARISALAACLGTDVSS